MNPPNHLTSCTILWSTQGGRSKACARRTARILRDTFIACDENASIAMDSGYYGSSFDDYGALEFLKLGGGEGKSQNEHHLNGGLKLIVLFVSTTGDGEQCDSIHETWNMLLQKSLPLDQFKGLTFALFCLGDRAYGPNAFCAAGRKLAARLVQLSAVPYCKVGYGDDGTPNGGVFRDLDSWLEGEFLIRMFGKSTHRQNEVIVHVPRPPYKIETKLVKHSNMQEWKTKACRESYNNFFKSQCPATAYRYSRDHGTRDGDNESEYKVCEPPLLGYITSNTRLTGKGWAQNTRHIGIFVRTKPQNFSGPPSKTRAVFGGDESKMVEKSMSDQTKASSIPLPYIAGDVATICPVNSKAVVDSFISCLPPSLQSMVDKPISVKTLITPSTQYSSSFTPWPTVATLRGILLHCADISSLPEREDLRALSVYCNPQHPTGSEQRDKLISLSETANAALYGDYVIREKRNWGDVFFDFDSIRYECDDCDGKVKKNTINFTSLTIEHLLLILPPIMPRHFSIASSPSRAIVMGHEHGYCQREAAFGFDLELCVAVVEGKTSRGRQYKGLCSGYLEDLKPSSEPIIRIWIRPGTFSELPLKLVSNRGEEKMCSFETPVMCIGAGTGIAPLRSLLQERESILALDQLDDDLGLETSRTVKQESFDHILIFGCRKSSADYYYKTEWERMKHLKILTAFSQDQERKIYVQRVAREADNGTLIAKHIIDNKGAIYVAGGAKMARSVRETIIKCLGIVLPGGENDAKRLIKRLHRSGKFRVEAWS